jgi:hypothetical protein
VVCTVELTVPNAHALVKANRWLLVCGAVAGPIFVVAFLIEGATRDGYNAVRHPISSLSLGDLGWMQVANFLLTGALAVCFGVGLWRVLHPSRSATWGPLLIGLVGIGQIGAGLFATDPVGGYPPGTPATTQITTSGLLHDLSALPVFLALPLACFIFARLFVRWRMVGWALYSVASGVVVLVFFFLANAGLSQSPDSVSYGGVFQRISLIAGYGWMSLLAVWLLRGEYREKVNNAG